LDSRRAPVLLDAFEIAAFARWLISHRLRFLYADSIALRALPLSLLVVDVPFQFLHRNFAALAGHG
jgi:hypothetical protein